jgi:hypothetical protein
MSFGPQGVKSVPIVYALQMYVALSWRMSATLMPTWYGGTSVAPTAGE